MLNRLTIRIGNGTLSFSVADKDGKVTYTPYEVKGGISMAANLREAFRADEWYASGWERALVLLYSPALILPVEEFSKEKCGTLYNYSFNGVENDILMHTVLPSQNAVAVFSINKDLRLVLDDNFSEMDVVHLCAPVWNNLHHRSFIGICQKLYGYFHDKQLEVFAYQKKRFRFCNSFSIKHNDDAVYFLLYVWKVLGLDQTRDELYVVGDMEESEALLTKLRRFLQNAYIINPAADFNRDVATKVEGMPYDLTTFYVKGL